MAKLKVYSYQVGPVCTNCYFAANTETKEAIIIDPGAAADYLIEQIEKEGLRPVAVLLTHGHFDHATAAADVASHFGVQIYAHELEKRDAGDSGAEPLRDGGNERPGISCGCLCKRRRDA